MLVTIRDRSFSGRLQLYLEIRVSPCYTNALDRSLCLAPALLLPEK